MDVYSKLNNALYQWGKKAQVQWVLEHPHKFTCAHIITFKITWSYYDTKLLIKFWCCISQSLKCLRKWNFQWFCAMQFSSSRQCLGIVRLPAGEVHLLPQHPCLIYLPTPLLCTNYFAMSSFHKLSHYITWWCHPSLTLFYYKLLITCSRA